MSRHRTYKEDRKTEKERENKIDKERQMERKYTQKVYRDKQESKLFSA